MPPQAKRFDRGGAAASQIAGDQYSELIVDQLVEERDRKTSLEQRAAAVITTSGAIVTVVFGFTSLVKGNGELHVSSTGLLELVVAAFLLLMAVTLALIIGLPRDYLEVDEKDLRQMVDKDYWINPQAVEARRRIAEVNVDILTSARGFNADKARFLFAAVALEVLGIVSLAFSLMTVALAA
jgi:hypothetical protein